MFNGLGLGQSQNTKHRQPMIFLNILQPVSVPAWTRTFAQPGVRGYHKHITPFALIIDVRELRWQYRGLFRRGGIRRLVLRSSG
jgi:hypothetical protein